MITTLNEESFGNFVEKGLVFVDFFANWCMPCKMMHPVLEELSEEFEGKMKFSEVDVDENQQLSAKYDISSIPNMILFKDGQPVERVIGVQSKENLKELFKNHL